MERQNGAATGQDANLAGGASAGGASAGGASAGSASAGAAFREGRLEEAIAAATAAVKAAPADIARRVLLAEFLIFAGNLERADVLLDAASDLDPGAAVVIAEFRQLLRAETARRQVWRDGRLPEFLDEPGDVERALLAALVAGRAGDVAEAQAQADAAEAARPAAPGEHSAAGAVESFEDFRDASDATAGILEVLTVTGKYYWVPIDRVEAIEFHPPVRPRDLIWRRASVSVAAGPDGDVYIPVTYFSDDAALGAEYRLGRATGWSEEGEGPVVGIGQREFLVGEAVLPIMEIGTLTFRHG